MRLGESDNSVCRTSPREWAGSVEISSMERRVALAARCAAYADETVVLPTPPLPMKNENRGALSQVSPLANCCLR